jgi:hypothetical protein
VSFLRPLILLVLLCAASGAFGGTIVRGCYGIRYIWDLEKVSQMDESGDTSALQRMYDKGDLTVLTTGQKVDVEELEWNPNWRKVRRNGELSEWYIPMQCVSLH